MLKVIIKIFDSILNFIYPNRCVFCQEIMAINEEDCICKYCYTDIDFICDDEEPKLSVFSYDEKTRYAIFRLKYHNQKQYAKVFAKMMYYKLLKIDISKYDYIIYVPMYIKKKKKRGYDQAEVIACELSKLCGIPIENNNLIRIKNTLPQSKVSFEKRSENVKDAFYVKNPSRINNKNILLIDDIYTTGNTINYCAKELKKAGANNICYFTLAKTIYKKDLENN